VDVSGICVRGLGAVSPAGWGVPDLRAALDKEEVLPAKPLSWPGWDKPLLAREVPAPSPRPVFFAHPRLRRASSITLHAAGAALEALESAGAAGAAQPARLGLVMCALAGCVQYSHRFFHETLNDPATASPLLFPETVFNAPASHLAALLERPPLTCTLLGDPATFLEGLALAADWLLEGRVEGCLVVGAEETNWLLADVLWHFDHRAVLAGGAGAIYLSRSPGESVGVELSLITDAQAYSTRRSRAQAAQQMRRALPADAPGELLCDSTQGRPRADAAEQAAWRDWTGERLSPKTILGEGLMAAGAWQCVAACDALVQKRFRAANVSIVGVNQKAIGARFVRSSG
jgi:3-oxoacyl-(acyl-carrier-protein) synthase